VSVISGPRIAAKPVLEATLKPADGLSTSYFGQSISASENTVVIGAPYEVPLSGAYVFVRSGAGWIQQAHLQLMIVVPDDFLGRAVAVSGDTLVVGQPEPDENGAAFVFVRRGTDWHQQTLLFPPIGDGARLFGISAAVSGDTVVIGAHSGAYVFVRKGAKWAQQAHLKGSYPLEQDGPMGSVVSVSGDTIVIGVSGDSSNATGVNGDGNNNESPNSGAAYVFARSGTTWTQQAYLKASNPSAGADFAKSVSVSDNTVAVGADAESGTTQGSGAAYVFVREGAN
jgi:hypothetical protein